MRILLCILLPPLLAAQEPAPVRDLALDLRTELGADPTLGIRLTPPGCWDGLLLGAVARPAKTARRGPAGATVEVWDLALWESPRGVVFGLYLGSLRQRLSKALELPPATHGTLELSELMLSDPSSPQKLDLIKVKSMQERYNKLPPNGSPVR